MTINTQQSNANKRIVITGMGIVSPLGCGIEHVWHRLIQGQSGVARLSDEIVATLPIKIGAKVPTINDDPIAGFDAEAIVPLRDQKRMDQFIIFALAAAQEALTQAHWYPQSEHEKQRTATIIASGIGGLHSITHTVHTLKDKGYKRLSPFTVPSFLANLAAGQISIQHGFKGPIGTPVTACAAGIQAIGDAMRLIHSNEADIALCGGAESCINEVSIGGFNAARTLASSYNDQPQKASRPFDQAREGFVIGEGAGLLVIESLEHALNRGATPIAELMGYGTTSDAYHITSGPEDGAGARRAMQLALNQASIDPHHVDYINAHATSTPVGDRGEIMAIRHLFNHPVALSSTKSATGHLLGAAGGIGAIFTAQALKHQIAPASLNCVTIDEAAQSLNIIANVAKAMPMNFALCNGFGFGGVNASILLKRWE